MNNSDQNPYRPPPQQPPPPETWRWPVPTYPRRPAPRRPWQPVRRYPTRRPRRRFPFLGCLVLFTPVVIVSLIVGLYFLFPARTNILLIGIDYAELPSYLARSDTLILTTFQPSEPFVGMLSIPRDLWVQIPGIGENRINTAHFYAEAAQSGSGPQAAMNTVEFNFGVKPDYYMRIRFEGFREVVDALGGVEIELDEPMAGYPAGTHFLRPRKALAFVRHRATSDDFSRMANGQFMLRMLLRNMLFPRNWSRIPAVIKAFSQVVDTNIPQWLWPRLGFTLLRVGPGGIDSRVINRDMTTPFITNAGASVLAPNWPAINVVLIEMFHR